MSASPDILLLDEPFANLDPVMRHEVVGAIREFHREARATVLYSTHLLDEVAPLATRFIILRAGEIAVDRRTADPESEAERSPGGIEALFLAHYGLSDDDRGADGPPASPADGDA